MVEGYIVPDEWIFQDEGYSDAKLLRSGLERLGGLACEGSIEAVPIYSAGPLESQICRSGFIYMRLTLFL